MRVRKLPACVASLKVDVNAQIQPWPDPEACESNVLVDFGEVVFRIEEPGEGTASIGVQGHPSAIPPVGEGRVEDIDVGDAGPEVVIKNAVCEQWSEKASPSRAELTRFQRRNFSISMVRPVYLLDRSLSLCVSLLKVVRPTQAHVGFHRHTNDSFERRWIARQGKHFSCLPGIATGDQEVCSD